MSVTEMLRVFLEANVSKSHYEKTNIVVVLDAWNVCPSSIVTITTLRYVLVNNKLARLLLSNVNMTTITQKPNATNYRPQKSPESDMGALNSSFHIHHGNRTHQTAVPLTIK